MPTSSSSLQRLLFILSCILCTGTLGIPALAAVTQGTLSAGGTLLADDPHLSSVVLSTTSVTVTYEEPSYLFGLLRTRIPVKITVESSGGAHVSYPWYGLFFTTDKAGLTIRAEAALRNTLSATSSAVFSPDIETQLADSLYQMLAGEAQAYATSTADVGP